MITCTPRATLVSTVHTFLRPPMIRRYGKRRDRDAMLRELVSNVLPYMRTLREDELHAIASGTAFHQSHYDGGLLNPGWITFEYARWPNRRTEPQLHIACKVVLGEIYAALLKRRMLPPLVDDDCSELLALVAQAA